MPNNCIILGCTNREGKDGTRMFGIPKLRRNEGEDVAEKTDRRLRLWLKAINRKDLRAESVQNHHKVCAEHFINGRPAYYMAERDPDWVPTLKLGNTTNGVSSPPSDCLKQRENRRKRKLDISAANALICLSEAEDCRRKVAVATDENELFPQPSSSKYNSSHILSQICVKEEVTNEDSSTHPFISDCMLSHTQNQISIKEEISVDEMIPKSSTVQCAEKSDAETQTTLSGKDIDCQKTVLQDMTVDIASLRSKITMMSFTEGMFTNNNDNVKYYTGLPSWEILDHLLAFLMPAMGHHGRNALSKFQEIILVLMRLRLGLPNKLIGDLFHVDKSTVSRIILRVLNIMYHNLKFLIFWPNRETFKETTHLDQEVDEQYSSSRGVTVNIDCFEILIEKPSNIKARVQTYSNYKHSNTIKYLIGITPQSSVCFISHGYGGATSDKFIIENSNFFSNLKLSDLVTSDRSFDCHDSISLMGAELKMPTVTKGKKQASSLRVESSRKVAAHLRPHVERVIAHMKMKYSILDSAIPIDYVLNSKKDSITTLDQIVTVCACLTNLCPSPVPVS